MTSGYQQSLFSTGQGRGQLFGTRTLDAYLAENANSPIADHNRRLARLRDWVASTSSTDATEANLENGFINQIFCDVLGYLPFPAAGSSPATFYPKPSSRITGIGTKPDAVVGHFSTTESNVEGVVELKSPKIDLDLPQAGYDYDTPVAQAFHYGKTILGVQWVIVSNMRLVRLYSVESEDEYEEVILSDCIVPGPEGTKAFRKMCFLFQHDSLIRGGADSHVARLYAKHASRQYEIRDAFYEAYYDIRADVFDAIKSAASGLEPQPSRPESWKVLNDYLIGSFLSATARTTRKS